MPSFRFDRLGPFQAGKSANIKRPREVTWFSFDDDHVCHPLSEQSLRYYYPPLFNAPGDLNQPRIDLSKGFSDFNKYSDAVDLHLDALLETIEKHEQQSNARVEANIITWRGMMTKVVKTLNKVDSAKILTAPFDEYSEFEMNATCFKDTIYIEENFKRKAESDTSRNSKRLSPISPQQMEFWGYKFEMISTLPRPWSECSREEIENRERSVVDNHAQYCSVVRTGIGDHTIIIGGEVDAIAGEKPEEPGAPVPYVELKTSQDFGNDRFGEQKFEKKLCRFWAQSFLLGVPLIVVGFRSRDGHLQRLLELKTIEIPATVLRNGFRSWDGNVCINFAAAFLDFLRQHVTEGVWRIEKKKDIREITLSRIEGHDDIVSQSFKIHRTNFETRSGEPT